MGDAGPKTDPRKRGKSSPWMPRLRKRGEKLLHSKYVVILVIILTITDCALVIAELILDLYSVKKTLSATESQTFKFIRHIRSKYPEDVTNADTVASIYDHLEHATILWNHSQDLQLQPQHYLDLDTEPTSTSSFGMPDSSMPNFIHPQGQGHNRYRNTFSQTVLIQNARNDHTDNNGNHSFFSDRRFRRSFRSNKTSEYDGSSFFYDHGNNETRTRKQIMEEVLFKLVHRFGRYLPTGMVNTNHSVFQNMASFSSFPTSTYGNNNNDFFDDDDDDDAVDDNDNDTGVTDDNDNDNDDSALEDLILFHDLLSEYLTMQLNDPSLQVFHKNGHSSSGLDPTAMDIDSTLEDSDDIDTLASDILEDDSTTTHVRDFDDGTAEYPHYGPTDDSTIPHASTFQRNTRDVQYNGEIATEYDNYDYIIPSAAAFAGENTAAGGSGSSRKRSSINDDDVDDGEDGGDDDNDDGIVIPGRFSRDTRKKENHDFAEEDVRRELHHSKEMEIAHKLHYASVGVVSVLAIEVAMKIICSGSHFLKRKIEVFDAVVIVTSIVVDLIFIKGLSEFAVDESIFVLAFLLPWRVIRVVNSLVMAVIDHEHVKLRLLYSRKKKLDKTVESLRNETDELKGMLQDVRQFCIKEGIESSRIDSMLGKFAPRRRKDSKFYTLVKLVMSTASINNNDNDSVSSSSMENDLRHYATRDSVLNEATSNEGTMTSLKQYLSVPFSTGLESRSISDVESIGGDPPAPSPSIFITSPASDDGTGGGVFTFCDVDMEGNDVVMTHQEPGESSDFDESEKDDVAKISVTSNTTNSNNTNGVAFFVGSQTSLDVGHSQENLGAVTTDNGHADTSHSPPSLQGGAAFANIVGAATGGAVDNNRNTGHQSPQHHSFGQYLTIPDPTVTISTDTNTASISMSSMGNNNHCNYNNNHHHVINIDDDADDDGGQSGGSGSHIAAVTSDANLDNLSQGMDGCSGDMRRSASDMSSVASGSSPYEGFKFHGPYGSPVPTRRLPEIRTKRKSYTRSRSESADKDNEFVTLQRQTAVAGRLRRNSGDPQTARQTIGRAGEQQRARSHSPSPMAYLSVPGKDIAGNDVTYSSSRSMNDVSSAGNPYANNLGSDGKVLRRSCLSLNSEGRKRRGKSPHRVSFKVS